MLLLFAHALASDRTDCHDGDLPACERVLGLEAGRLIASGDDGVPDVRLTTSFAVVAERACELGNAGACSYLQRTPPELPTPLDPRVRRFDGLGVPLPGGTWIALREGELGTTGRWVAGAEHAALVGDAVVLSGPTGWLVVDRKGVRAPSLEAAPTGTRVCSEHQHPGARIRYTAPDCGLREGKVGQAVRPDGSVVRWEAPGVAEKTLVSGEHVARLRYKPDKQRYFVLVDDRPRGPRGELVDLHTDGSLLLIDGTGRGELAEVVLVRPDGERSIALEAQRTLVGGRVVAGFLPDGRIAAGGRAPARPGAQR